MPRLTDEQKKEIRKLQESGLSDGEISRITSIPYITIYNQRPEIKAKQHEYRQRPEIKAKQREYYQRPEIKAKKHEYRQRPDPHFQRFQYLTQNRENLGSILQLEDRSNPYILILKCLSDTNFGKKHKQITRQIGKRVTHELKKLIQTNLVIYTEEGRYSLNNGGKESCKYLFEC